jgi:hypothetical protein
VKGCVLLFGESKVEDVPSIVPSRCHGGSGNRRMGLLYEDDCAGGRLDDGGERQEAYPASLVTRSIARRTWRALGEANTFPQTAAGVSMRHRVAPRQEEVPESIPWPVTWRDPTTASVRVRTHKGRVGRFVARAAPTDECDLGAVLAGEVHDWRRMSTARGWMADAPLFAGSRARSGLRTQRPRRASLTRSAGELQKCVGIVALF